MNAIKVMVNGLPGKMSSTLAEHIVKDARFELISYSCTGPEITETECTIQSQTIKLVQLRDKERVIAKIKKEAGEMISVDYSHPSAVNPNAEFYCLHGLPFVMGTTGGDRKKLVETVEKSSIAAVIAPNMAKQIVGFQAMMEFAANNFPGLFEGYSLEIRESHQHGKADTSGTAKAMVGYFNNLGTPFVETDIIKERNPEIQQKVWGIPEQYLKGHGWHTYSLRSKDKTVQFAFTHNVNGRDIYARGTIDAILFLQTQIRSGAKGKVFSMIDVLRQGAA